MSGNQFAANNYLATPVEHWSVIFGVVMTAASTPLQLTGQPIIHQGFLATGALLLVLPALYRLAVQNFHAVHIAVMLGVLMMIEALNLIHLQEPLELKPLIQRIVCYAFCFSGFIYSQESAGTTRDLPLIVHGILAAMIGGVAFYWLNAASTSAGVRFTGDTEQLTPVGVGYCFGVLASVSSTMMLSERAWIARGVHALIYCACLMAILSTGSRGSFGFALLVFIGGLLAGIRSTSDLLRYVAALLVFATLCTVAVLFSDYARSQFEFLLSRFSFVSSGRADLSLILRQEIRSSYLNNIDSWIFTGYHGYAFQYPHNVFFECVLRFGLAGLVPITAVLYAVYKAVASFRCLKHESLPLLISLLGVFTLLVMQVNLMLEHGRFLWLFVGYWACRHPSAKTRTLQLRHDSQTVQHAF